MAHTLRFAGDKTSEPKTPQMITASLRTALCLTLVLCAGVLWRTSGAHATAPREHHPATPFVLMGDDSPGDAPEGFDLTAFKIRRIGPDLEFRFEMAGLREFKHWPYSGTVWWDLGTSRDGNDTQWWIVADLDSPERYYVEWSCCPVDGGGFTDSWNVEGEYNWEDGYVSVFVPVKILGPPGTTLSHCRESYWYTCPEENVKVHSHLGSHSLIVWETRETDSMRIKRNYVIPRKPRS